LRADAPATRQHAIAAGAASPATPLANAADELMPMTAAAAMGQTWLGTSRFSITLPFAARRGTVRRREWLGSAANGRMAAVAAIVVQSSWLRINVMYAGTPGCDQCDE
jgi:hypothetical protein